MHLYIKLKIKQLRLIKDKLSDFPSYIYDYKLMEGDLLFFEIMVAKIDMTFCFWKVTLERSEMKFY